jgi:hypothetical protein
MRLISDKEWEMISRDDLSALELGFW